jgi:signal transduction histidine kinase
MLKDNKIPELDRYRRLIELSRDLASTLNLDVLLNRIVHVAADLTNAEAASIMLYDEIQGQLYFHSATNIDKPVMRGLIVPVEGSIAGWIFTNQKPVIVGDAHSDPRYYGHVEKAIQFTTNSILGVPLITKNKIVGVLEAINNQAGNFTEDDQDVLMTLGAQAAVAIENARLFQQSDLIAEFVHELRTPLASINAAAHLLQRPEVSEEQHAQMAEVINNETLRLSEMATSFLDYARLESGRTTFNIQSFDLSELLNECVRVMRIKGQEQGVSLEVELAEDLPSIEADRDKLKQVVLNLLSNALKYNRPNGTINLSARSQGGEAIIAVKDTGIGIESEVIPRLFEKFYRAPGSDHISIGTGLGLSITQRIVETHGGKIQVKSKVGKGSTFTVRLPLSRQYVTAEK